LASLGRFDDGAGAPGCEAAGARKRLLLRLGVAVATILLAIWFGSGV